MSTKGAIRTPYWAKRGYDSKREYERGRDYESGSSHSRRRHDRDDEDVQPILVGRKQQKTMLDITAGFYPLAEPSAPNYKRGLRIEGMLEGQLVRGEIVQIVQPPFGDVQYTLAFTDGTRRTIPESRLKGLLFRLRTAVAAPPMQVIERPADAAVSGAIVLAQTMAIVPFGFWK